MTSAQEKRPPITDLRSALQRLADHPGQLIETHHPVDPNSELAGVYRRIGAGGTVMRPTRIGPAMMLNSVIGFPDVRVLVDLTASRERVGILFDSPPNRLIQRMAEACRDAIAPVKFSGDQAPCQQVVRRADEPGFDLRTILPAPTNTDRDAGPFSAWDWCSAAIPADLC
jgi:4-hydroxy-3-polyprenylbenzoate decarboxylase